MTIKIQDIAYHLPEQVLENDVLKNISPDWDMNIVEERVGVMRRHIARADETALDLALEACKKLFSRHNQVKELIDAIIFCSQSQDYIMPPNACILHKNLELNENVLAFDFNLACSGYIYGLVLSEGLICSKRAKNILLINADTYSKYVSDKDRSVKVLFGDGAAVSWITKSSDKDGLIDIQCSTYGKLYERFIIPAGGCRMPKSEKTSLPITDKSGNIRTLENIYMDGMGILTFVNSRVPKQINEILTRNKLTIDDIDLFIFHQASKLALDRLKNSLNIKDEKLFTNLSTIGNTVSASIPIALKEALEKKIIKKGDKVVLSGFGVGLSWGSAILKI